MAVVGAGMKGGKVTLTLGTRMELLAPAQATHLAEELARLAFRCVNGTEPPSTRSVLASEIRKRFRGEIRDEAIARCKASFERLLVEGKPLDIVIEELAELMLARIG